MQHGPAASSGSNPKAPGSAGGYLLNHTDTRCDCDPAAASPLALRWRCPVCGKTAIMKMSTLAAVCDGDIIRKAEPEVLLDSSGPPS
jgi:hypothetical protein